MNLQLIQNLFKKKFDIKYKYFLIIVSIFWPLLVIIFTLMLVYFIIIGIDIVLTLIMIKINRRKSK